MRDIMYEESGRTRGRLQVVSIRRPFSMDSENLFSYFFSLFCCRDHPSPYIIGPVRRTYGAGLRGQAPVLPQVHLRRFEQRGMYQQVSRLQHQDLT